MIKMIIEKGYAYVKNGTVYFDVERYNTEFSYGQLTNRKLEELLEGTRELSGQDEKKGRLDFALWIQAKPETLMKWPSPWGWGFPGWHIECSAMSSKYLGDTFDIHGGGMDLQFPHHESEIAQSKICNHHTPAKYWIHNNMITVNGRKMGKSYNNQIKLTELFDGTHPLLTQAFDPMTIRFFILQSHYRSPIDFSSEALQSSEKAFKRLWEAYELLKNLSAPDGQPAADLALEEKVVSQLQELETFMDDDFSTAKVLANLFELAPVINSIKDGHIAINAISSSTLQLMKKSFSIYLEDIMGLKNAAAEKGNTLNGVMQLLIDIRKEAKEKKDYATSDKIRKQLLSQGIILKDEKDGNMSWGLE
jgi:cysteinyl-tRNA synthetase